MLLLDPREIADPNFFEKKPILLNVDKKYEKNEENDLVELTDLGDLPEMN